MGRLAFYKYQLPNVPLHCASKIITLKLIVTENNLLQVWCTTSKIRSKVGDGGFDQFARNGRSVQTFVGGVPVAASETVVIVSSL